MIIDKIFPTLDKSLLLKRFNTQPNDPTNQNSLKSTNNYYITKVPKVVKPTNKKTL